MANQTSQKWYDLRTVLPVALHPSPLFFLSFRVQAQEVAAAEAAQALVHRRPSWCAANRRHLIWLHPPARVGDCLGFEPDLAPSLSVSGFVIDREFCGPGQPAGRSAQLSNTGPDRS